MKVLILGGDGFCGWPTALHLSDAGHEVVIIDNLSRRKIDVELGAQSLTPISSPEVRVDTWNSMTGQNLRYVYMDLAGEYDKFTQLLKDEKPDTLVHFAEQRAAPNFSGGVDAMDDMAEAARQRREEAKVLRNEEAARQAAAGQTERAERSARWEIIYGAYFRARPRRTW